MPLVWKKTLLGIAVLLLGGLGIGALYGVPLTGLLTAALIVMAYQLRQLYRLERAIAADELDDLLLGEGIWSELAARVNFLRQRVRKNKRRHRKLLKEVRNSTNAMPDGAAILNDRFEIVMSNKAAKNLSGIRSVQDRGQRIDNILRDPAFVEFLRRKPATSGDTVKIVSPVNPDRWLSCRLVAFGADQYMLLLRDITDSELSDRVRRDFVSNASHELRSPLTVISGYLDTLAGDADVPPEWKQPVSQMRLQAERMNRIVADLLELSRLENPQSDRDSETVDVAALLALARREWAGQPGVPELRVEVSTNSRLSGISSEIESVISNLLVNAIRHTKPDGCIEMAWHGGRNGGAILSVTDNGEGIDPDHIPRLTERFFRVDQGRSREAGGSGLGLAIVKHALVRHDASLEITSKPGKGSTFSCHFPASRLRQPETGPQPA